MNWPFDSPSPQRKLRVNLDSNPGLAARAIAQTIRSVLFVLLLTIVYCGSRLARADWPMVRGDASASGVATSSLADDLDVLWKYTLDDSGFEATAVIVDRVVYLADVDGTFHAVRLADGELIWKKHFDDSGFLAGAAVADDHIFVGDFNGMVRCLAAASGELVWSYQAKGECYAAPNVVDNKVLITTEAGELIALDSKTGKRQWLFTIEAPLRCWPTAIGGRVLLAGCDQRLHVVDVSTGEEVDRVDIDGPTGSTPAVVDGEVLFGTEQGSFYSIDAKPAAIRWRYQDASRVQSIRTAAAADRRVVIFGNQGKQIVALNRADGELQWTFRTHSNVKSSPVIAGDRVFFGTKRGRLHAVDILTGKETWQYQAGGSFVASPAVDDQRLILGNIDGTLYCFGKKE